jgi:hypothetical protein
MQLIVHQRIKPRATSRLGGLGSPIQGFGDSMSNHRSLTNLPLLRRRNALPNEVLLRSD